MDPSFALPSPKKLLHNVYVQIDWIHIGCLRGTRGVKESGLRIRVDSELREEFVRACKKDDLTAAQVLRAFMRLYIDRQQRGQQTELFSEDELNAIRFGRGQ